MSLQVIAQVLTGAFSAAAIVLAAIAAYRSNVRATEIESAKSPYSELADRVKALEDQVSGLLHSQWEDRTFIRILLAAWPPGHPFPLKGMPGWVQAIYGLPPQHPPTPGGTEPPGE